MPSAIVVVASLLVLFGGYRALSAVRRQRESEMRMRTLIAEVQAQEFAEVMRVHLNRVADVVLRPPGAGDIGVHLDQLLQRADSLWTCRCAGIPRVVGVFGVSEEGKMIRAPRGDTEVLARAADSAMARRRAEPATELALIITGSNAGVPWLILAKQAPGDGAPRLLGAVVDVTTLTAHVSAYVTGNKASTMPATLARVAPRDSAVGFEVWTRDTTKLSIFGVQHEPSHAIAEAWSSDGSLRVTARLDPRVSQAVASIVGPRVEQEVLLVTLLVCCLLIGVLILALRARGLARFRQHFAVAAAHELRTPLTQILLYGETLALNRVETPAKREQAASIIVREGRRMMEAVESILHHTSAERRRLVLPTEPLGVVELVTEVFDKQGGAAAAAGVTLQSDVPPYLRVLANPDATQRALGNLIDNAVKHARGTRVLVTGRRMNDLVRITVDDDGQGIPRTLHRRIFEPFVRGPDAAPGGTGIGLAIVAEAVEAMNGRVGIGTSTLGGTCVNIDLPGYNG